MWNRSILSSHKVSEIESRSRRSQQTLARPEVQSYQYSFAGSITLVFASGVGLCLGQPQLRGERRFEQPRRGTEYLGRAARERNGGIGGRLRRRRGSLLKSKTSARRSYVRARADQGTARTIKCSGRVYTGRKPGSKPDTPIENMRYFHRDSHNLMTLHRISLVWVPGDGPRLTWKTGER